jgi:hypothetical protein
MTYLIYGQRYGERSRREHWRCKSNPQAIVDAAARKKIFLGKHNGRRIYVRKFENLEIREVKDV